MYRNTCRSPMAEGFLKEMLKGNSMEIEVSSAGIATVDGLPATEKAVVAMGDYGIDISSHRSRIANEKILCDATLILTMSMVHKETIKMLPKYRHKKIFTLKEFLGYAETDVKDPFGLGIETYKSTASEISILIGELYDKISKGELQI